jgi:integrase
MVRRRVTTGGGIASRAASRRSLGSLRTLRVQPRTRARYTAAVDSFFEDLAQQGIALPRRSASLDEEVAEHLDRLWLGGISRSYAGDVISGLQFFVPGLKGNLRGAWAALSVWQRHEEPERALPFTDETAEALAGTALASGQLRLATCVLLGQVALLRPAEFCGLDLGGVVFSRDGLRAVLNLGWTKGGQRKGVREGVTVTDTLLLVLLRLAVEEAKHCGRLLPGGPAEFQRLFTGLLKSLGLGLIGFTPYSLRRGGATSIMARCGDVNVLTGIGRWGNVATARLYVDGAAQQRTEIRFNAAQLRGIAAARRQLFVMTA